TEIQPLIGSKEGILHISMAFLNPGDGVLVPNPGYPTYASVTQLVQAEAFTYKLLPENGWEPDFEALEAMDLSRVKLMWVNYPNMPTGAKATMALFEKLVDFGRRHGIVICNDNPYSFILNEDYLSLLKVPGALEGCIELNSMSKSHNMPGWRIGMLATNPTFLQWIMQVKSNVDSGQFRPMQLAAVEALKADQTWYAGMNAVYKRRRLLAESILKALGCTWDPAQSGLFLWGRVPENGLDGAALSDKVLYEANVFITPGFIFGSQGERYVRLSLCCTEENLAKALERVNTLK
ncbi:MAG: aminotransferase class I/II-fold pyridoxal phosphate-dependent enzyme, partial [Bacteroidales bacterium]|nr:aminotransferase class I/II-fold pyridoxal phosphate-dependent enzyme [Bacteroidales bacterium]